MFLLPLVTSACPALGAPTATDVDQITIPEDSHCFTHYLNHHLRAVWLFRYIWRFDWGLVILLWLEMTVSEANCEGGSFTSHRGQNGKSTRSEEGKIRKDNIHVDELSEEIAHISLKESRRESAVENELEEKLGGLSISAVPSPKLEQAKDGISVDTVVEGDANEKKSSQLKLNITEQRDDKELNNTEVKEEKKYAQKNSILDLNIIVNDDAKISSGDEEDKDEDEDEDARKDGELCPRSPMRPEHANVRCEPYQGGAPRSRHHSSGGFCVTEATSNYSIDQTKWTNIPIYFEANHSSSPLGYGSPPFPFSCAMSPAEETDEGIYDLSPEEICDPNKCDTLPELSPEVIREVLDQFEKRGIWNELAQPITDFGFPPKTDHIYSPIPVSVEEFDCPCTEGASTQNTFDSPLSVGSSGYNSLYSPRSTNSTPSPSSSLKGSQERINVGFNDQHGNIGSVGFETSSFQASPMYQSPVYFDVSSKESRSSSVHFNVLEMPVASKPKSLAPKPTFSKGSGKMRLNEKMDKIKKSATWAKVSTASDACLVSADVDGDTPLMILLMSVPKENDCKLEMIYALVERLCKIPNALTAVNRQGQSALYMAALHYPTMHGELITRYIADALLSVGATLDTCYEEGNSLLHYLCRQGAMGYKSLKELLTLNKTQSCFNLDSFNYQGMTPLHVAVTSHQGKQLDCSTTVRLLIEAGANATLLTENESRYSALHLAIKGSCDPILITALLSSASVAALCGEAPYRQDTVLHLVARRNDLPFAQQSNVYKKLVEQKAHKDVRDSKGKLPIDLIAADRKEGIKQMIHQK